METALLKAGFLLREPVSIRLRTLKQENPEQFPVLMKKIIGIVFALLAVAGLVTFMVVKAQSGYTKVLTAKVTRRISPPSSAALARSSRRPM